MRKSILIVTNNNDADEIAFPLSTRITFPGHGY